MSKINCKTESRIIIEHPIGLLNPVAALLIQQSSFSKCDSEQGAKLPDSNLVDAEVAEGLVAVGTGMPEAAVACLPPLIERLKLPPVATRRAPRPAWVTASMAGGPT